MSGFRLDQRCCRQPGKRGGDFISVIDRPNVPAMLTLRPDSPLVATIKPSPSHDARSGTGRADMLLLHYTGMADGQVALERLCAPDSRVSAHYVLFEDGRIVQCVAEARRAWHAGESSWEGESDINSRSIGIEIVNPGHDLGCPDFPAVQIEAVIALCQDIIARHRIRADLVVGHSDVAPHRKRDPGEKFPWRRLYEAGVGLWVEPVEITTEAGLRLGDHGTAVARVQALLGTYGYGVTRSGSFDEFTRHVVVAFQRHFRPALVDGVADRSTIATLERLIIARAAIP